MENLNALHTFLEKVDAGEKSFTISNKDYSYHFISCKHGKAEYYYYCREYGTFDFRKLTNKYEIAAIVAANKVYIVDTYCFSIYQWEKIKNIVPSYVCCFSSFVEELNSVFHNIVYPKYYEEFTETMVDSDDFSKKNLTEVARHVIFEHKPVNYDVNGINDISYEKAAFALCEGSAIQEACLSAVNEQKEDIDYLKSRATCIQRLIDSGEVAEEWEIKLADAVNKTNAKTVVAEFELGGKTWEVKINTERIISKLIHNDYFSEWDFPSMSIGRTLFTALSASSYGYTPESNLYAKNIKSVSFRGKKIYERKE